MTKKTINKDSQKSSRIVNLFYFKHLGRWGVFWHSNCMVKNKYENMSKMDDVYCILLPK
jgi:hypothetical protein